MRALQSDTIYEARIQKYNIVNGHMRFLLTNLIDEAGNIIEHIWLTKTTYKMRDIILDKYHSTRSIKFEGQVYTYQRANGSTDKNLKLIKIY